MSAQVIEFPELDEEQPPPVLSVLSELDTGATTIELARLLGLSITRTKHELNRLYRAGLVSVRASGLRARQVWWAAS